MDGLLLLPCCAVPVALVMCIVAGCGCLILAEQRDGHRGWQAAAWLCFLVPVLLAGWFAWRLR